MNNSQLEKIISQELQTVQKEYSFIEKDIDIKPIEVAQYIDHTLLKSTATVQDIKLLCRQAKENNFFSVCVNSAYVSLAKEELRSSKVKVATVIGFPLGVCDSSVKVYETQSALDDGADEFDMVINVGMLKSLDYEYVYREIKDIVEQADKKIVKVIIETCYLTREEKIAACVISKLAGAHFVKTSTGFGTGGATMEDVSLMKFVVGEDVKVKAAGGIKDYDTAKKMIACGAQRLGASAGIKIIKGEKSEEKY